MDRDLYSIGKVQSAKCSGHRSASSSGSSLQSPVFLHCIDDRWNVSAQHLHLLHHGHSCLSYPHWYMPINDGGALQILSQTVHHFFGSFFFANVGNFKYAIAAMSSASNPCFTITSLVCSGARGGCSSLAYPVSSHSSAVCGFFLSCRRPMTLPPQQGQSPYHRWTPWPMWANVGQ